MIARLGLPLLPAAALTLAVSWPSAPEPAALDPDEPAILKVDVHPRTLAFDDRFERAQLLITAELEDGRVIDITRDAEILGTDGLVEVDAFGLVRPRSDGEGALRFRVGEHTLAIPVGVRDVAAPFEPSFVRDILPILSRIGCNAGTCHGSAQGKNGFKLSLRGYDPDADHLALTDDLSGRRFNPVVPEQSLFLLKTTGSVPHGGGRILEETSDDYELLRLWVSQGSRYDESILRPASIEIVPNEPTLADAGSEQQFAVLAHYADGTTRDVTTHSFLETSDIEILSVADRGLVTGLRRGEAAVLARYEGQYAATRVVVMGERSGYEWNDAPAFNPIDEHVHEKQRRVRVLPSTLCSDDEFLRRATLDLTGRLPSVAEARTFLMDRRDSRAKRVELVDRLIGSAEFVEFWTSKWADLLQVNSKFLGEEGAKRFRGWIQASVASNQPYDEFVRAILGASGSTYENPPANYYKVLREADLAMENTTQLFLGVRFNCNKCHDHPFERWTRADHWELAAAFGQVGRKNAPGSPIMPRIGVDAPPAYEEIIEDLAEGEVLDPETNEVVPMAFPFEHEGAVPAAGTRRERLVAWMTAEENPYFAKSYVNRLWSYFLGVGIIDPVDDIRASNPPSNPALLDYLTDDFVANGFDVRALMRMICTSRTYQLSVETNPWNSDDAVNFARGAARRLPAEVLHDAVHQAAGSKAEWNGARAGTTAVALLDPSVETGDGFLGLFGRPPRESSCECERSGGVSLGQALSLVNGPTVADAIADPRNGIVDMAADESDAGAMIDELYLAFLSRYPTEEERQQIAPTFDPLRIENRYALDPAQEREVWQGFEAWLAGIRVPNWTPLVVDSLRSTSGTQFVALDDGSIGTTGESPDKDKYTVLAGSELTSITGLRLEVLPDESLPAKGPGRAENGNFVLHEFRVSHVPLGDPTQGAAVTLQRATANFSQNGWPVAKAIDGSYEGGSGWAVSNRFGVPHEAIFELKEDLAVTPDSLLVFELDQQYGSMHVIGRFRLSATGDERPVRHHELPDDVAAAFRTPAAERSDAQVAALYAHYVSTKPELHQPIRLGAARDLAWALANSSEFLFNR